MQIKYSGEHSVCDASCSVLEVLRSDSPLLTEKQQHLLSQLRVFTESKQIRACMCVCVCACVRACVRACVCACVCMR